MIEIKKRLLALLAALSLGWVIFIGVVLSFNSYRTFDYQAFGVGMLPVGLIWMVIFIFKVFNGFQLRITRRVLGSVLVVIGVSSSIYFSYSKNQEREELGFQTKLEWDWHQKDLRIQIATIKNDNVSRSILRKVYMDEGRIIYAEKTDNYTLLADVKFLVDCAPGSKIDTLQTFSSGNKKIMKCNKEGEFFSYGVSWSSKGSDHSWSENFDGFSFSENFATWDFTKLDREITLSKAK